MTQANNVAIESSQINSSGVLQPAGGGTGVTTSTGSGNNVLSTSPTLVTPALGTPSSAVLTNATGLPVGGISATGTPSSTTYLRGDSTWATVTSNPGTVTSITAGTGLSGGTITSSGTIAVANTAVTAGSYTNASVTVNAQGQLTAASSGTAPVTSVGAGTGISSSGGTTPTITNTGVTSVSAGTGISVSASTGGVTITNTSPGTTYSGGTGISVSGSTITNTAPAVTAGEAKAWLSYNGIAGTFRASYNVSSVTNNGTGDFTIYFTNALTDGNYAITGTAQNRAGDGATLFLSVSAQTAPTSSYVRVRIQNPSSQETPPAFYVAIFR
jgi:hypothetical protein